MVVIMKEASKDKGGSLKFQEQTDGRNMANDGLKGTLH